jgi:hypothetical protein
LTAAEKTPGVPIAKRRQSSLMKRIATSLVAAKARSKERVVSGNPQRREEQLRDPTVSRRNRMIGRLERCVEGDAHSL